MTTMRWRQARRERAERLNASPWHRGFRAGVCIALLVALAAVLVAARLSGVA